ncbi:MAG: alkylphosphonate utilization protein [Paracoccaceae bacterium]|jgi:alpha-D-ribose 1-methylphosphonate 5-triphosphate diphosphatase|nr:alkylphosphonate utilization protein [Paracoccaceae bacterium]
MSLVSALQSGAIARPVPLPPLRFTGGETLRAGALQRRSLAVEAGRIVRGPLPEVDMSGFLLLPGIVDLRCDALEADAGAPAHARHALARAGRAAAAGGITTGWLTQGWSWEGGAHGPAHAERMLAAHAAWRCQAPGDLRLRLRAETHLTDDADRLLGAVRRHGVDLVVFSDRAGAIAEDAAAPVELRRRAEAALARKAEVPRHLCRLAEAFDTMGVTYGSLGDADGETRERYSMIGAGLADAPASRSAAAAAKAMHEPVVLAAPDLVRQPRPGPAAAFVAQGLCDALASADDGAAPVAAAFALADRGVRDLASAWALVSSRPAEIMGLADRGTLEHGKRADFVAIDPQTRAVEMTVARGHLTHLGAAAAERLCKAVSSLGIAAE